MRPPACLCFPRSDVTVFFFVFVFSPRLILLRFLQLDMNLNMASVFHCALEDLWSFCPMTLPSHNCVPPSAHAPWSAVRSVRSLSSKWSFLSRPMLFSCFSFFFPPLSQWGRREEGEAASAVPTRVPHAAHPCTSGAGTVGARFLCLFFFLFLWRPPRIPAHPLWFISRFGPVRTRQPLPRGGPESGAGRPPARSMRPPCWRIVCHLNLHPPTPG